MTIAAGVVLVLALALIATVANTAPLSAGVRWLLLMLTLVAGILVALHLQGVL